MSARQPIRQRQPDRAIFSRHYHRAANEPTIIPRMNRRDMEKFREDRKTRLLKRFSIAMAVASLALGLLLVSLLFIFR
ncbi:hypothetical protein HZ994_05450 [Akkermansiaceae bacterium]|nr:hypothetical protein HZ994_05450 [Akkermansiaceae bacterium]